LKLREPRGVPAESANIARHLPLMAARQPDRPAIKVPRGRTPAGDIDYLVLSFAELDAEVDAWCARLVARGVRAGDRTLLMVRPGLPLIAAAFALFKIGAIPVVIDPGMGWRPFLACVARSRPRVLIGIPLARILSRLFRPSFRTVSLRIAASRSMTAQLHRKLDWGNWKPDKVQPGPDAGIGELGVGQPAGELSGIRYPKSEMAVTRASDLAAVLFTSGSTGSPKGVCYEHGMFDAQVRLIRDTYAITPGEVDLPMLSVFALFDPALGLTAVVPELDPNHPASVDPAKIVQAIRQENVTNSFGSPTLWRKIGDHCLANRLTLPSLRRVLCAGAAVPASLWRDAPRFLPNGALHSPYGATEVLPVSSIAGGAIDSALAQGAPVGRPLSENRVKIIAVHDGPIATLAAARELPPGEIGEIIVTGPTVTREYDQLPEATSLAKIPDTGNRIPDSPSAVAAALPGIPNPVSGIPIWHRMGDAGYLDRNGCLWFCGRVAERLETLAGPMFTEPCEQVFRTHPAVARCALIGLGPRGQQEPALVVEAAAGAAVDPLTLARALRNLALQYPHTAAIRRFFLHPRFPVDVRHNAKIHRLTLARWAASAKGVEVTGIK
jgi:acyl-CoA synthetase (AMP-forming)/AMP-acid ligase II